VIGLFVLGVTFAFEANRLLFAEANLHGKNSYCCRRETISECPVSRGVASL